MALAVICLLGTGIFLAQGFWGYSQDWNGVLPWYILAVALTLVVGLTRPRGRRDVWQIVQRLCAPWALAAVAEANLRVHGTFEFLGLTLALATYLAVWVAVGGGFTLATLELAYRLLGVVRGAPFQGGLSFGSVGEFVFAVMDRIYLAEPMEVGLGAGEQVEMVINPSRWTTVYEVLWRRFWLWLGISLGVGFLAAAVIFVLTAGQSLLDGQLTEAVIPFHWWLMVVVALGLESFALTYTWFIEEWNRRQLRFVFMTGTAWVARTRAPEGTVYLSFGPAASLEEIKLHSPGEKAGQENQSFWGRIWDGILWSRLHVGDFFLPSRVFGAADTLEGVEWPMGTFNALRAIASGAKVLGGAKEVAGHLINEAKLADAQAPGWVTARAQKADQVLAAFNALLPPGPTIDLRRVTDPGLWDRRAGEKVAPATAASRATAVLATFPAADGGS